MATATYGLAASADPEAVFAGLADLLVPFVCDSASASILTGRDLARWEENPSLDADVPIFDPVTEAWTATIHLWSAHPEPDGWTGDHEYVAELCCAWVGLARPAASGIAAIKLAGRVAVGAVTQAQQAQLVVAQDQQLRHLRLALATNRRIGAAIGVLMSQGHRTADQAWSALVRSSQEQNRKVADLAQQILDLG